MNRCATVRYDRRDQGFSIRTRIKCMHVRIKRQAIKPFLAGGVFANGGMVSLFKEKEIRITAMEQEGLQPVLEILQAFSVKLKIYRHEEKVYKITGMGPRTLQAYEALQEMLAAGGDHAKWTLVLEGEYLEITAGEAKKLAGVLQICEYYGYERNKVLVAGNGENDREMLDYFPMSVLRKDGEA